MNDDRATNRRNDSTTAVRTDHKVLSFFQCCWIQVCLGQIPDATHLTLSADAATLGKRTPTSLYLTTTSHKRDYIFELFSLWLLNILHKPHGRRLDRISKEMGDTDASTGNLYQYCETADDLTLIPTGVCTFGWGFGVCTSTKASRQSVYLNFADVDYHELKRFLSAGRLPKVFLWLRRRLRW